MKRLKTFFWICSGANQSLLELCPTESSRYVGIGASVFFTGLFAALSSGYALYSVFDSYWMAVAFGLIWGLMIFNLDRFIVSSLRKTGNPQKEWLAAIPRLILAVIISIVIARPLELKIFGKEIVHELAQMSQEDLIKRMDQVRIQYLPDQERLRSEIATLKQELHNKTQYRDDLRLLAQTEADGTGGSQQRNAGPIYQIKKAAADQVENELQQLNNTYEPLIAMKERALWEMETKEKNELAQLYAKINDGLAAKIEALGRITDRSNVIATAHLFILLLFILIEIAPIVVKLIAYRGPYDYLLSQAEFVYELEYKEQLVKQAAARKKRNSKLSRTEFEILDAQIDLSLSKI